MEKANRVIDDIQYALQPDDKTNVPTRALTYKECQAVFNVFMDINDIVQSVPLVSCVRIFKQLLPVHEPCP